MDLRSVQKPLKSRVKLAVSTILATVALVSGPSSAQEAEPVAADPRPNIIVVMTDDQAKKTLRFMPSVQRDLIREGVSFKRAYAAQPLCCPNRTSFLTGRYVHNHGVNGNNGSRTWETPLDHSMIPVWMDSAGYTTAYFGKYLHEYSRPYVPPGWDKWDAFEGMPMKVDGLHESDYLARESTEWLRHTAASTAPRFMVVAPVTPHRPTVIPERYLSVPTVRLPDPPSFNERNVSDKPPRAQKRLLRGERLRDMRIHWKKNQRALRAVDDLVAGLLRELEVQGELQNTYIMLTSDNGYFWGEHRLDRKHFPYEEGAGVPLVVRGPGVQRGIAISHLVSTIDLAPTIADLGGAGIGKRVDGRSLAPLFSADRMASGRWRDRILIENHTSAAKYDAMRTRKGLYAVSTYKGKVYKEFYSAQRDPYQLRNSHNSLPGNKQKALGSKLRTLDRCEMEECRRADR